MRVFTLLLAFVVLIAACGGNVKDLCPVNHRFMLYYRLTDVGACPFAEGSEWGPVVLTQSGFLDIVPCSGSSHMNDSCVVSIHASCQGDEWNETLDLNTGRGELQYTGKDCQSLFTVFVKEVP